MEKEPTKLQEKGAELYNQYRLIEVATGQSVPLNKVLEQAGYSKSSANKAQKIINTEGFKIALKEKEALTAEIESSFLGRLILIQNGIIAKLEEKGMSTASYRDIKDLLGTINGMIRLGQDKSTENVAVVTQEITTEQQAKDYLKTVFPQSLS